MRLVYRKLWLVYFLLILAACQQKKQAADGQVIAVKDGDTIEILENGQPVKVRLAEVDAPEKNQEFGTQSKKFTSDLAFGKSVQLIRHETDRYGRVVATVILPDGRNLNRELVTQGYAWHYKDYSKDQTLASLETDARVYRRGLWSHPNPVAPWEFRKMQREGKFKKPPKPVTAKKQVTKAKLTDTVWICSSKTVKVYHLSRDCSRLKNCSKRVESYTLERAQIQGKNKSCSVCG